MEPAYVLLVVVIALIAVAAQALRDTRKQIKETHGECDKLGKRIIMIETMLAIYLHHAGFDMQKVTRAIKENMEELEQNGSPGVGCIKVKELYRDNEE